MKSGASPILIASVLVGYFAFLGGVIFLVVHFTRKRFAKRTAAISQIFEANGARRLGPVSSGGFFYRGAEYEYDWRGRRVVAGVRDITRYTYRTSLRILTSSLPYVVIFPEGKVERLGKSIGLSRELQTGDPSFDGVAYVDTTEKNPPVRQLLESARVRSSILRLLSLGYKVQFSNEGIQAYQVVSHGKMPDLSRVGEAVSSLGELADSLPIFDPSTFRGKVGASRFHLLLLVFAWVPFLFAMGLLDAVFDSPGGRTLHFGGGGVTLLAIVGGLIAWVFYVGIIAVLLRGRSYAFRTLIFAALAALLGVPGFGVMAALTLNQTLDRSPAIENPAKLVRKFQYEGDRKFFLEPGSEGQALQEIPVSDAVYSSYRVGDSVLLRVHSGAFGLPWVEPMTLPAAK